MDSMNAMQAQVEALGRQVSGLESSLRVNSAFQQSQQLNAGANPISVSTSSEYSIGTDLAASQATFSNTVAWYGTDDGLGASTCFVPLTLPFSLLSGAPQAFASGTGSTITTAIYDRHGSKLVDSSTTQKLTLSPGLYYMAVNATKPSTTTFTGWTLPAGTVSALDVWWQTTNGVLPAQRPNSTSLGLNLVRVPLLIIGYGFWAPT